MSKKRNTFCTVAQWLEQEDIDLYNAVDSLCALSVIRPKGDAGVTFIYPEDKKIRDKIINAQYADGDAQIAAEKLIKAHTLYINFADPSAFIQHAKDIPNALGNRVKFIKTSGNSVELDGGVVITPDKGFIARGDRKNMSVWRMSKGEMPITGEKHTFKQERGGAKKTGGGRQPIVERAKFAACIEERYRTSLLRGTLNINDPYPEAILSLLIWLKHSGHTDIMRSILACTSANWMVEFYNIFQPYRSSGHLLSDSLFVEWQNSTMGYCFIDKPALYLLDFYKNLNESKASDAFASAESRATLRAAQNNERNNIAHDMARSTLASHIKELYSNVSRTNKLGNIDEVYPPALANYYKSDPANKCMEEEVRFIVGNAFRDMLAESSTPQEYVAAHIEICKLLKIRLNFNGGFADCTIFDPAKQESSVFWYSGPLALLRSSHFLFCGSAQSDETRSFLSEIPEPTQATMVDTVGHEWAFWQSRASSYSEKQTASVLAAARLVVELATKEGL